MWHHPPIHHKRTHTPEPARRERDTLMSVQGPGVVPVLAASEPGDDGLRTRGGHGSLADLLAERRTLLECECRGVGIDLAATLSRVHTRGVAHGDVKPANVVFEPGGGLWLVDFDAGGPVGSPRRRATPGRLADPTRLVSSDDVVALAVLVVECATGVVIDPVVSWPAWSLAGLGCPTELAVDVEAILARPDPTTAAAVLRRRPARLPRPASRPEGRDPTPTVDLELTDPTSLSAVAGNATALG